MRLKKYPGILDIRLKFDPKLRSYVVKKGLKT